MLKIAVVLYGPPGSGKGTQANLLADKLGIIHFDTGRFLESILHDPKRQKNKKIKEMRRLFDTGKLVTPSWFFKMEKEKIKKVHDAGEGIIFSGSPRTIFETERVLPLLKKFFGSKNIYVFALRIPEAVSVRRNSARLICSSCGSPLLTEYFPAKTPKYCPRCGAKLYRRTVDNPATIKVRLKEYRERTEPVLGFMKKKGVKVYVIDGRPAPYKIFEKIYGFVKNAR